MALGPLTAQDFASAAALLPSAAEIEDLTQVGIQAWDAVEAHPRADQQQEEQP